MVKVASPLFAGNARAPIIEVGAHRQVGKQIGLLKHITERTLMRGEKLPLVLPDLAIDDQPAARGPLQTRHAAQNAGLAAARGTEQSRHAASGQAECHAQRKAGMIQFEVQFDAHLRRFQPLACNSSSTTNENSSMPPASQWAWAYSMASTWL